MESLSKQIESAARRLSVYVALGFLLALAMVGGLVAHGVWQQHRVLDDIESLLELRTKKITLASNLEAVSRQRTQIVFAQVLSDEAEERASLMGQYLETSERFEKLLNQFAAVPQDGADSADVGRLRAIEERHGELHEQALMLITKGERDTAIRMLRERALPLQETETEIIDSIRVHQQQRMVEQSGQTRAQARQAMWISAGLGVSACAMIALVFFGVRWLLKERSRTVNQKAQEIERLSEELFVEATQDPLTGLMNRRMFFQELERSVGRSKTQNTTLALAYIDLDHFKPINDQFGHAAGDQLLKTIAERMRGALTDGDVVARLGGDEFALVCEGANAATIVEVETRLRAAISEPIVLQGVSINPQLSVGFALYPLHAQSVDELLAYADQLMYAQKAERKRSAASDADAARRPAKISRSARASATSDRSAIAVADATSMATDASAVPNDRR
ncbi:MAG: diguanylate cyclase [Betaproteobacteria bacterium]|nr:MAG: diguanylate cyclase [Betaproteobacteria bacterium]